MRYLITCILCSTAFILMAFTGPDQPKSAHSEKGLAFKMNCAQATAQTDLDINNVRARLLVGGDFGWDGSNGRYIVPKVEPGVPEVSSLFAGAIWLGGVDPAGNLKLAAQQYGTATGASDYWPGPLTATGQTDAETCENWDRFFTVTSAEIDLHISQFQQAQNENIAYDAALIPKRIKEWPAVGNEYFFGETGFELPSEVQGLAPFWDNNADGIYSPQFGDYPIIEIRGCNSPQYADEMIFWIFNDAGNIHTQSMGDALQMEVQAMSFAYATEDAVNDMTFSRYKLINRAQESLAETHFGIWLDPDLGCGADDYIGCDTIRDLMYVYNSDAVDGSSGANCAGGVPTYGEKIPYFGVDYFRGPLALKVFGANGELVNPSSAQSADTIVELGMTSFIYFTNPSTGEDPNMLEPSTASDYYNYLSGVWRSGLPMTIGGSGLGGTETTKFAFHDEPNNEDGWSMCTANLPMNDMRTVQASGPFRLFPGQINEMIIGIPWVPDVEYPCPDMSRLFAADDLAQNLFDSCFETTTSTSTVAEHNAQLDQIEVFPNPAAASSSLVKIANIPTQSVVSIYTLDGKLVRQFQGEEKLGNNQESTLDWDLRSATGNPVPSGIYLIHVQADDVGTRVMKLSVLD